MTSRPTGTQGHLRTGLFDTPGQRSYSIPWGLVSSSPWSPGVVRALRSIHTPVSKPALLPSHDLNKYGLSEHWSQPKTQVPGLRDREPTTKISLSSAKSRRDSGAPGTPFWGSLGKGCSASTGRGRNLLRMKPAELAWCLGACQSSEASVITMPAQLGVKATGEVSATRLCCRQYVLSPWPRA